MEELVMYQQGDVLIKKVDKLPEGLIKTHDKRGHVLAEGEATGHFHAIKETEKATMYERDGKLYLNVIDECDVTHQEHHKITLPKGDYEIDRVQEWDYFEQEARAVID